MHKYIFFLLIISFSKVAFSEENSQSTTGNKSPAIITNSGDVNINYNEKNNIENKKEEIQEVAASFYSNYLKYLNMEFSEEDDKSGFSQPTPRKADGSIDIEKIQSAPAYGIAKLSLAEYLYTRDEIDHTFAQKIDKLILEAMQDPENDLGGLGYDPILMAQDTPIDMDYSEPKINGNKATIEFFTVWPEYTSKSAILVKLKKVGKRWRIKDIIDSSL